MFNAWVVLYAVLLEINSLITVALISLKQIKQKKKKKKLDFKIGSQDFYVTTPLMNLVVFTLLKLTMNFMY